jgi:integrase
MGINNGLRISDLLKLKVSDVRDIKPGQTLKVKETKTGKINILIINKSVHKVLKQYLEEVKPSDEDYLFQSRNGNNKPLARETVNKMIKEWAKSLKGNYGTHTPYERPSDTSRGQNMAFHLRCCVRGLVTPLQRSP